MSAYYCDYMRRFGLIIILLLLTSMHLAAQQRIFRTESFAYETREQAEERNRDLCNRYLPLLPYAIEKVEGKHLLMSRFNVEHSWSDSEIYVHLENIGSAYTLLVNGKEVYSMEDSFTPAEFVITPFTHQGMNDLTIALRASRHPELQQGLASTPRPSMENCYVVSRRKVGIRDFDVELRPDSLNRFGVLDLQLIVGNSFNYEEPLTVGYDIYSPSGKLLEYSVKEVTIEGRSTDTVRFTPYIYNTNQNRWGEGKAPLYTLTLYIKVGAVLREYIPMQIGFGKTEFIDGNICRFGKPLKIKRTTLNASATLLETHTRITELKKQGYNTFCPEYPQPDWFYSLCDRHGVYVIDRANINAPIDREIRTVNGTPSNNPSLVDEYIERVKGMYYRSRNHSCIIAYELGGASGNGYNMYKAYEWLKSVEKELPVIYSDADGEWNSDIVKNLE